MTIIDPRPLIGVREAVAADRNRIEEFVRGHPAATPFHLPGWGEAVAAGCGQRSRYLIAERADGGILGVLPLTDVRSPLFGRAMVSSGFGVGGGILGDAVDALAAGASDLARRIGAPSVELRGGPVPAGWSRDDSSYVGFVRPLAADDEAELKAVPRKQRAEIRRAQGLDLTVSVGRSDSDLAAHYQVYSESVRNLGTPVFPKQLFSNVMKEMDADILTVWSQSRPAASVLSLYLNGTVYPYWGGGAATARPLRANDHMYFSLMSHARARGCTSFDFGRSKTGTGAATFKKNWGFTPVPLVYARHSDGPGRAVNPLDPKYALMIATWKRLPLWVANRIGPPIARGLG